MNVINDNFNNDSSLIQNLLRKFQQILYLYLYLYHNMFDLPNEDNLRLYTSYTNIFMLTLVWNVGIFAIIFFCLFLISLLLKLYHINKQRQQFTRQSLLTHDSGNRNSQNTVKTQEDEENPNENQNKNKGKRNQKKITLFDVTNFATSLFFYLLLISISLIYLSVYAFGEIGEGTAHDIIAAGIIWLIVTIPTIIWKAKTKVKKFKNIQKQVIFTIVMLVLWLGVSIFSLIAMRQVCVCVFNDNYGVRINKDFAFSTAFSRSYQIQKVCEDEKVCHVYATLPENTDSSVFINVHTGLSLTDLTVTLMNNDIAISKLSTEYISVQNIDEMGERNVFSVLFNTLLPDTLYDLTIKKTETNQILYQHKYKTLPTSETEEIRMAVGGDVGFRGDGEKITKYLVQYNPHVLIIGGDIAYDDGMRSCYYSWDNFYQIFEQFYDQVGRIVPLVLSVGNHDVGYDALTTYRTETSNDQIPFFFLFNPQHINDYKKQFFNEEGQHNHKGKDIPEPAERSTYHHHIIGPTVHVNLDSGYITAFEDQCSFIELMSTKYPHLYKFANYHNPLYPSCTNSEPDSNDVNVIKKGTKYWTPLFDKGDYIAAFEHHTHHRKFTHKIRDGKVVDKGTRYIGDGSWGVPVGKCGSHRQTNHTDLFEDYDKEDPNHIWKITIRKKSQRTHEISYMAINLENNIVFNKTDNLQLRHD